MLSLLYLLTIKYYDILLNYGEVKTTFRRLAKLYHRDKWNPSKNITSKEGCEKFKHNSNTYQSILPLC